MERKKTKPSQGRAKKPTQKATKDELTTHRITDTKTELKKQPLVVRSVALTAANEQTLASVKQMVSDYAGWAVSTSGVLRALVRFLEQQPSSWVAQHIQPLVEEEIEEGRVWGSKGKKGKPESVRLAECRQSMT